MTYEEFQRLPAVLKTHHMRKIMDMSYYTLVSYVDLHPELLLNGKQRQDGAPRLYIKERVAQLVFPDSSARQPKTRKEKL